MNPSYDTPSDELRAMTSLICMLLTLLFSLSSPAIGGNSDFGPFSLAQKTTPSTTALTKYWPDNNAFVGEAAETFLYKDQKIDRYGGGDWSRYFSPQGTPDFARALPPGTAGQPLRAFEVIKPFPVQSGQVALAFCQMGGGTQMVSPVSIKNLLEKSILKETTR